MWAKINSTEKNCGNPVSKAAVVILVYLDQIFTFSELRFRIMHRSSSICLFKFRSQSVNYFWYEDWYFVTAKENERTVVFSGVLNLMHTQTARR